MGFISVLVIFFIVGMRYCFFCVRYSIRVIFGLFFGGENLESWGGGER